MAIDRPSAFPSRDPRRAWRDSRSTVLACALYAAGFLVSGVLAAPRHLAVTAALTGIFLALAAAAYRGSRRAGTVALLVALGGHTAAAALARSAERLPTPGEWILLWLLFQGWWGQRALPPGPREGRRRLRPVGPTAVDALMLPRGWPFFDDSVEARRAVARASAALPFALLQGAMLVVDPGLREPYVFSPEAFWTAAALLAVDGIRGIRYLQRRPATMTSTTEASLPLQGLLTTTLRLAAVVTTIFLFPLPKGTRPFTGTPRHSGSHLAATELSRRAAVLAARYHLDEAEPLLEEAARLCPGCVDPLVVRAEALFRLRRYRDAMELARRAALVDAENARLMALTARLIVRFGKDPREALPYFRHADELAPDDAETLADWFLIRLYTGESAPELADELQRRQQQAPARLDLRRAGAELLTAIGDNASAARELQSILRRDKRDVRARLALGRAYRDAGRREDAARELALAASIDDLAAEGWLEAALLEVELGRNGAAAFYLEQLLQRVPIYPEARRVLAGIELDLGNRSRAIALLREETRLRPEDRRASAELAALVRNGAPNRRRNPASDGNVARATRAYESGRKKARTTLESFRDAPAERRRR